MSPLVEIRANPAGRRLYLRGHRAHHGVIGGVGAGLAFVLRRPRVAIFLLLYGVSDWRDFPFRDCDNH
jgi:hypothetical protein